MSSFKPNKGFQVNRAHWSAQGLTHCYLLDARGSGVELIRRESYVPNASATIPLSSTTRRFGRATASDGTAARFINAGTNSSWCRNQTRYTIAALVKCLAVPASNTNAVIMYESTPTGSSTRFSFRLLTNSGSTIINWQYVFRSTDASAAQIVSFGSGVRVSAGDEAVLMATYDSNAAVQNLYVNGIVEGTTGISSTVSDTASAFRQFLVDQSSNTFNGNIAAAFVWRGKTFDATMAARFAVDPYAMFTQPTRRRAIASPGIVQVLDPLILGAAL